MIVNTVSIEHCIVSGNLIVSSVSVLSEHLLYIVTAFFQGRVGCQDVYVWTYKLEVVLYFLIRHWKFLGEIVAFLLATQLLFSPVASAKVKNMQSAML